MADEIRTIVVGTSLDDSSESVVRLGAEAARAAGAKLHLVHAVSSLPVGGWGWTPPLDATGILVSEEEDRQRAALAEQASRAGAEWSLETGPPHRVIADLAERLGADLVVVGAATGGGPIARMLGSTADRVVRKASRPVLVARGELRLPPRRVLAPVDLSPLSGQALRRGLDVLAALGGGGDIPFPLVEALFVLSVVQRQTSPQFTPEQIDRLADEELERFASAHAGLAALSRRVRTGNVREEILAELAGSGVDLVLIGTHGHGGFDRFVIGSVASDIVREAPCSVLVIPPSES